MGESFAELRIEIATRGTEIRAYDSIQKKILGGKGCPHLHKPVPYQTIEIQPTHLILDHAT